MSSIEIAPLLGLVLAGGRSSRMGACKATLAHPNGSTFLLRTIGELQSLCEHVACSINADQTDLAASLTPRVDILIDQSGNRGPVEGLALAMRLAISNGCTGVLVVPVDLPYLHAHELRALSDEFERTPDRIVSAAAVDASDKTEPLVAVYPISLSVQIQRLVKSDDRSLFRFIHRNPHQIVLLSARSLTNVNTYEDLKT